MINLRVVTSAEFFEDSRIQSLVDEYAAECANPELPKPVPCRALYEAMEQAGVLVPVVAFEDDEPIGFVVMLVSVVPHYSELIGVTESLYVGREVRNLATWLRLKGYAEAVAKERGAKGVLMTAPVGSNLAKILEVSGCYRETNRMFFRPFAN